VVTRGARRRSSAILPFVTSSTLGVQLCRSRRVSWRESARITRRRCGSGVRCVCVEGVRTRRAGTVDCACMVAHADQLSEQRGHPPQLTAIDDRTNESQHVNAGRILITFTRRECATCADAVRVCPTCAPAPAQWANTTFHMTHHGYVTTMWGSPVTFVPVIPGAARWADRA
jgi:hypothetical protein